ncbi:MAG: CHAP domain-containing protein [Acidimicrobiales bacterium]
MTCSSHVTSRSVARRAALLSTSLVAVASLLINTAGTTAGAATGCMSFGYSCTIDGYNATSMNNSWAAKYYGSDTTGGIGTPPHNCTLFAAWMLAHNGLVDPGRSWGYADQWGQTLAAETNDTPAIGSIAWYVEGAMGHVAYVAHINWANNTVLLISDNYSGGVNGYTSNSWVPITQPTGYIHVRDLPAPRGPVARRQ